MSDEEIYSDPAEQAEIKVTSVAMLKKAFELQKRMPIQVATDGRFQSRDNPTTRLPKPSVKPKPDCMPDLPAKLAQLRSIKKPLLPPGVNNQKPKTVTKSLDTEPVTSLDDRVPGLSPINADVTSGMTASQITARKASTRKSSDRESIYPPRRSRESSHTTELTNGECISHTPLHSPDGVYRLRPLPPPPDNGPPPKPSNIDVNLDQWTQFNPEEGYDPDEIYDDILPEEDFAVRRDDNDLPPPPASMVRPVSIIPDMSEDEEFRELGNKTKRLDTIVDDDDDELYDDVDIFNNGDEGNDEIYQDIG